LFPAFSSPSVTYIIGSAGVESIAKYTLCTAALGTSALKILDITFVLKLCISKFYMNKQELDITVLCNWDFLILAIATDSSHCFLCSSE
jgi:hypothetical protein